MKTLFDRWDDYLGSTGDDSLLKAVDDEIGIVDLVARQAGKVLDRTGLNVTLDGAFREEPMKGIKVEGDGCFFAFGHNSKGTLVLWKTGSAPLHETVIAKGLYVQNEELAPDGWTFLVPKDGLTIYSRTPLNNPLAPSGTFTFGKILVYGRSGQLADMKTFVKSADSQISQAEFVDGVRTPTHLQCDAFVVSSGKRIRLPGEGKGKPTLDIPMKIDISSISALVRRQVEKFQEAAIRKLTPKDAPCD